MARFGQRGREGLSPILLIRLAMRNVRKSVRRSLLTASAMVLPGPAHPLAHLG